MKILKSARFEFYPVISTVRFATGTGKSYKKKELVYNKDWYSIAENDWKAFLAERDLSKKNGKFAHALNMPTKERDWLGVLVFAMNVLWCYDFGKVEKP